MALFQSQIYFQNYTTKEKFCHKMGHLQKNCKKQFVNNKMSDFLFHELFRLSLFKNNGCLYILLELPTSWHSVLKQTKKQANRQATSTNASSAPFPSQISTKEELNFFFPVAGYFDMTSFIYSNILNTKSHQTWINLSQLWHQRTSNFKLQCNALTLVTFLRRESTQLLATTNRFMRAEVWPCFS